MNITAEKLREGTMSLKHVSTARLVIEACAAEGELKNLMAMEIEQRHDPVTGLGMGGK